MKQKISTGTMVLIIAGLTGMLIASGCGTSEPAKQTKQQQNAAPEVKAPAPVTPAPAVQTPEPQTNAVPPPATPMQPRALQNVMRFEVPNDSALAVCRDVGWVYETMVGCEPPLGVKPIVIRKSPDGMPRACLNWLPQEYGINITGPDTMLYCQIVFQFAHEMSHVYINPYKGGWFAESVCHAMIYVCLDAMAEKWKTNPPYNNWFSYGPNFASYCKDDIASQLKHYNLSSAEDAHAWIKTGLPEAISKGDFDRPMQFMSAIVLLDIIRQHPNSLGAIAKLGEAIGGEKGSVDFQKWRQLVTPEQQPLVDAIAKEFTFPGVWPVAAAQQPNP